MQAPSTKVNAGASQPLEPLKGQIAKIPSTAAQAPSTTFGAGLFAIYGQGFVQRTNFPTQLPYAERRQAVKLAKASIEVTSADRSSVAHPGTATGSLTAASPDSHLDPIPLATLHMSPTPTTIPHTSPGAAFAATGSNEDLVPGIAGAPHADSTRSASMSPEDLSVAGVARAMGQLDHIVETVTADSPVEVSDPVSQSDFHGIAAHATNSLLHESCVTMAHQTLRHRRCGGIYVLTPH